MAERESPLLSPLVAEWLDTGAAATGIRDSSMRRYRSSWKHVERSGLVGKATRLSGIHQSFVSAFKAYRNREAVKALKQITNATLNRDLAAIGAFLTWCTDERGYKIERPKLKYLQESKGRMKWLTAEEVARFQQHCPSERWPLFALMMSTGLSIGEVLGLRVCDVDRNTMMISIHESGGRALKRRSRARNLIVSQRVMGWINEEVARGDGAPTSRIFPMTYWPWRKIWKRTCEKAQITEARMHDSRHTFAIHAVQNGVPESRLQSLLGHAHPGTTRRYAMFAPGQFAKEDMATVSESIGFEAAARRVAGPRMVNPEIPVDIIDQKVSATSQIPCSETLT
jgi:integrase